MLKRLLCALCLITAAAAQTQIELGTQVKGTLPAVRMSATVLTTVGQQLVYDSSQYKPQNKMEIDVRDLGVDCTGTTDSTPALNALTTVNHRIDGKWLKFPPACNVTLGSTWLIKNQMGFQIGGTAHDSAAGPSQVPTLTWIGAANGTMINMQHAYGFEVSRMTINGGGTAQVGINVDMESPGGIWITTDGLFDRLFVSPNIYGLPAVNNWVGLQLSAVSGVNVEDMRMYNSRFHCQGQSGSKAIRIANSFNAKNYAIEHNFIHACGIGVSQEQGQANIQYNEFGDNNLDIMLGYWTDPARISYNLSESALPGSRFLDVTGQVSHIVEITGNNLPINNTCAITFEGGGTFTSPSGNTFYNAYNGGAGGSPICVGTRATNPLQYTGTASLYDISPWSYSSLATYPGGGRNYIEGNNSSGTLSTIPKAIIQSTGNTIYKEGIHYNVNDSNLGFGPDVYGRGLSIDPCGTNTLCMYEGAAEVSGVASPDFLGCGVTGGGTGGTHTYFVSAVDGAGNETLARYSSQSQNVNNCYNAPGPGQYDASHYETIYWMASPGAASYKVYARSPSANSQMALIASGLTGTSYQFNGPYPTSFPLSYTNNLYNKALSYLFRGKDFQFQYGTPLRGFSDKGSTQTWSINSTTGNAVFNQVNTALSTPSSSSATCTTGTIWADTNYVYVCTATNNIKRAALSTF